MRPPEWQNTRALDGNYMRPLDGQPTRLLEWQNVEPPAFQNIGPSHLPQYMPPEWQNMTPPGLPQYLPPGAQIAMPSEFQATRPMGSHSIRATHSHLTSQTDSEHNGDECANCNDLKERLKNTQEEIKTLQRKYWPFEVEHFKALKPNEDVEYDEAEKLYKDLTDSFYSLEVGAGQLNKLLCLKNAYVAMQIRRKEYQRAEEVIKKTWKNWRDKDADESRLSYRYWSMALREQEKYVVLEGWLRRTWPDRGGEEQSDIATLWMFENGDQLCDVLELQGKTDASCFNNAYDLRQNLWTQRKKVQGLYHKDTLQTGLSAALCRIKQVEELEESPDLTESERRLDIPFYTQQAVKALKQIWELWDNSKERSKAALDILTGGHKLGFLLYRQKAYNEAKRILQVVWVERKARFMHDPQTAMLTGHYLFLTHIRLGEIQDAQLIFEEVWNGMKFVRGGSSEGSVLDAYHSSIEFLRNASTTESASKLVAEPRETQTSGEYREMLEAFFEIGRAFLRQEKYQEAESILQEVYSAYGAARGFGPHHDHTLTCGRYLGEAIAKPGRCLEAARILNHVLERRAQPGMENELEVLDCHHLYDYLLTKHAKPEDPSQQIPKPVQEPENVFNRVWQTRNEPVTPGLDGDKLLKCGRSLVSTLINSGNFPDAERVLGEMWSLENRAAEEKSSESLAFCRHLGISLMDRSQYAMATGVFQRALAQQKALQSWAGAAEEGYYLGVCLMKQQLYPEAESMLVEVTAIIERADLCKNCPLAKATTATLDGLRRARVELSMRKREDGRKYRGRNKPPR
jgi:hypothetical protein